MTFRSFADHKVLPCRGGDASPRRLGALVVASLGLLAGVAPVRADNASGLSQRVIAATLGRIADDARRLQLVTLEAVLTPDAEIAVQSSVTGALQTLRYSKAEYLAIAKKMYASLESERIGYSYAEGPPSIRLAPDGRTAVVVGTSTETLAFPDGRSMSTTTRSTLHFIWQDGRAMIERVQAIDQTPPPTPR